MKREEFVLAVEDSSYALVKDVCDVPPVVGICSNCGAEETIVVTYKLGWRAALASHAHYGFELMKRFMWDHLLSQLTIPP